VPSAGRAAAFALPRSLARSAVVDASGTITLSIHEFFDNQSGPHSIFAPTTTNSSSQGLASWLPPALQIVDARRDAAARWPADGTDVDMSPLAPIVRTGTDSLFHLDGQPIVDPQGRQIVLP
jgi:hypothetical protein